jgi:conserved domain protein
VGKERREQGHLERKKRVVKKRKIPLEELKAFVEAHPDAFLQEIGHILIMLSLQYGQL